MAARLLREAQVGASLDPERVVRVFDVGTLEDGTPIIVLERLDGESMAERLARVERVSVEVAIAWISEACIGLGDAHRKGIVHRDVKPSNLFLETRRDRGERLRILDFGIASIRAAAGGVTDSHSLTDSHAAIGSPPYMSPEQIRNSETVDARADVWALGVTLFELIAGRRPFVGVGSAVVASIVSDPVPRLSAFGVEADPALENLIANCMDRDPTRRPKDAQALGELLAALPPEASASPTKPSRPPILAARSALAIAIVLGVASLAGAAWEMTRPPTRRANARLEQSSVPVVPTEQAHGLAQEASFPTAAISEAPVVAPPTPMQPSDDANARPQNTPRTAFVPSRPTVPTAHSA